MTKYVFDPEAGLWTVGGNLLSKMAPGDVILVPDDQTHDLFTRAAKALNIDVTVKINTQEEEQDHVQL